MIEFESWIFAGHFNPLYGVKRIARNEVRVNCFYCDLGLLLKQYPKEIKCRIGEGQTVRDKIEQGAYWTA